MNHIVCCSPVPHLLCSPHQEWIAFDEYLQRDLRLIKSGNLARYVILSLVIWEFNSLIGGARGAHGVYRADLHHVCTLKWRGSGKGDYLINDWPHLKTMVIASLIHFPFSSWSIPFFSMHVCECVSIVTTDQALSFPWVTRLITAPSSLIPNSLGRACQTPYAERRGDFEMLLMTLGYNYPLSFTPTHSFFLSVFLVHSCHLHWRSFSFLFAPILLYQLISKYKGEGCEWKGFVRWMKANVGKLRSDVINVKTSLCPNVI